MGSFKLAGWGLKVKSELGKQGFKELQFVKDRIDKIGLQSAKLVFDITSNYIGESRIPEHPLIKKEYSEPFFLHNAQITRIFRYFDVYIGGENLSSYTQETPILAVDNPNSIDFDASLIYAPIHGRMIYAGFRYKIK